MAKVTGKRKNSEKASKNKHNKKDPPSKGISLGFLQFFFPVAVVLVALLFPSFFTNKQDDIIKQEDDVQAVPKDHTVPASSIATNNPNAFRDGLASLQRGDAIEAIPLLEEALLADPRDAERLAVLGQAYSARELWSPAVNMFTALLHHHPLFQSAAHAHAALARALENLYRIDEALNHAMEAMKLPGGESAMLSIYRQDISAALNHLHEKRNRLTDVMKECQNHPRCALHPLVQENFPARIAKLLAEETEEDYRAKAPLEIQLEIPVDFAMDGLVAVDISNKVSKRLEAEGVVHIKPKKRQNPLVSDAALDAVLTRLQSFKGGSHVPSEEGSYVSDLGGEHSAAYVRDEHRRTHFTLTREEAEPALSTIGKALLAILGPIIGDDAQVVELAALSSYSGAVAQEVHADTITIPRIQGLEPDALLISVWIPLVDVTMEMGPLEVWPGIRVESIDNEDIWIRTALLTHTNWSVPVLAQRGSLYMYDSRIQHRGGANKGGEETPRYMMYLSLQSRNGRRPSGSTYSLHPSLDHSKGGIALTLEMLGQEDI